MNSRIRYVTYVEKSLSGFVWTVPRLSKERSYRSAENMVSSKLLSDMGIDPGFCDFSNVLRTNYPEVVISSRQYIGETREIELPEGVTPKQFQSQFHVVRCNPLLEDEDMEKPP